MPLSKLSKLIGIACIATFVLILFLIFLSFRKLNSYESKFMVLGFKLIRKLSLTIETLFLLKVGIKYDQIAKVLGSEVKGEGLHVGPPGFTFIIFPSVYKTMEFRDISVFIWA
jgi:hypothetical protein